MRLLIRFAPQDAYPSEIAAILGMKRNTLSHYLADLTGSGLVLVARQGRRRSYRVDLSALGDLVGYLALDTSRARAEILSPLFQTADALPGPLARQGPKADPTLAPAQTPPFTVLFLCTGNSARSIIAQTLLRDLGQGRFHACSAGFQPETGVNPFALDILRRNGHSTMDLRPKPLADYQSPDAPTMDFVFTVCDIAAAKDCPPWQDQPVTGHWGLPDPARTVGTDALRALAFAQTYAALYRRISAFVALPFDSLSRLSLQSHVDAIGKTPLIKD